jgi:DNA-binding MltR family transcriptional regulator
MSNRTALPAKGIFSSRTRRRIKAAYRIFIVASKRIFNVGEKLVRRIFSRKNRYRVKAVLRALLRAIRRYLKLCIKLMIRALKYIDEHI